jgi:hypothetical protein
MYTYELITPFCVFCLCAPSCSTGQECETSNCKKRTATMEGSVSGIAGMTVWTGTCTAHASVPVNGFARAGGAQRQAGGLRSWNVHDGDG